MIRDQDANDTEVIIDKIRVWNSEDATAEGSDLAEIIVYDARGVMLGRVHDRVTLATFSTGGVEIPFIRSSINLDDDAQTTITIVYVLATPVAGRTLQPKAQAWCDEGRSYSWSPVATYPEAVTLYPGGSERVEELEMRPETVFSAQRVCVMKVKLVDLDQNTAPVFINPVVVRNLGTAEPGDVVGLEITDPDGTVLGQARSLSGFRDSGVTITLDTTQVPDDGELWVWITAADPDRDITGKDVRLALTILQSEAGQGYQATVESAYTWPLEQNNPPTVDFSWTPEEPRWDEEVTFTPNVSDPDDDALVRFEWDFNGDGTVDETTDSDQPVTYTYSDYPEGGRFEVTLTVTDARGLTGTKTKQITVQPRPNQPPTAEFDWNPKPPEAGDVVTFTAEASDPDDPPDTPLTYAWDFGDGTTLPASEDNQVTHTYAAAGTYTVTLTVTDARGAETEVQKEITVAEAVNDPPQVTAIQITPASPEAKQEITFTATTVDPEGDAITSWEWDFDGDGTVDTTTTTNTATHTYTASGFYTVKVRAKDGDGSGSFGPWYTKEFYVRGKGAAAIGTRLTQNPVATEAVIEFFVPEGAADIRLRVFDLLGRPVFDSTTPAGDRFRWDLTDGNGRAVPNGLYFYLITATLDGRTIRSEVGRILVLR